jgi:hypothetical protein
MEARELWEAITFDPELGLEHGDSHWKYLDEQEDNGALEKRY